MDLPKFLQVEPVGQCNLRCQMCPIQFRQDGPPHGPPAFMDFDVFTRLLDQFPDLEELQLQGLGEPMMHPRFFDMVELRRRPGDQGQHQHEPDAAERRGGPSAASPAGWARSTSRSTGPRPRPTSGSASAPTSTG